jgi:ATP-dependent helicase HepA
VLNEADFNRAAGRIPKATAQELIRHARNQIGTLIEQAQAQTGRMQEEMIAQANDKMNAEMEQELSRLTLLAERNPNIRQQEKDYLIDKQQQGVQAIASAKLMLDAIRVAIVTEA